MSKIIKMNSEQHDVPKLADAKHGDRKNEEWWVVTADRFVANRYENALVRLVNGSNDKGKQIAGVNYECVCECVCECKCSDCKNECVCECNCQCGFG
ncbi:MAG: hypothetical protein HYU98_01180 [Deltaproteobacteria bacterium]|nr:hypothetical protein [Deltaproteobacteria bacterium]